MRKFAIACVIALTSTSSVMAGRPVPQETTCAIGGEVFETLETMSCSAMGATLSLRSITSCDFVTKLPVCPGNALPMYKEFTDADKAEITALMETAAYKDAKSQDKYYRAYLIDTQLTSANVKSQYFMLQGGIWYGDPTKTLDNADYMTAYHTAADTYLESVKDEPDAPFYRGGQAFAYFLTGNKLAATAQLAAAKAAATGENAYRDTYFKALENCFAGNVGTELCKSDTPIRAHEANEKP